ncbi:ABC transporter ATP-binding protein [Zooshikella harenae]|nr:ABC transporter ATP-binding protein [Zooshikella harenae]
MNNFTPLLQVKHLSVHTIQQISFNLFAQVCMCIQGASGTGKSLLLKALADLIPAQGEVLLQNQKQTDIEPSQWRRYVTLVPAMPSWWHPTAGEHFSCNIDNYLTQLGLPHSIVQQPIHTLSTGEKQRLAILRALQHNPYVLLLDEPTANLDPVSQSRLEQFLFDNFLQQTDRSIIWVAHHPSPWLVDRAQNFTLHGGCLSGDD